MAKKQPAKKSGRRSNVRANKTQEPERKSFATVDQVAAHYNVGRRTVFEWKNARPPMPSHDVPGKPSVYYQDEIDAWLELRKKKKPVDENEAAKQRRLQLEELEAKVRKENALADQHEVKAKALDPVFVSALQVNQFLATFFAELRKNVRAIPSEMCASYPKEFRDIVKQDLSDRHELLLNQMGDWVEEFNRRTEIEEPDGLGDSSGDDQGDSAT